MGLPIENGDDNFLFLLETGSPPEIELPAGDFQY